MAKVMICSNTAWSIAIFRAGLIRALCDKGYEVVAAAPADDDVPRIEQAGARFVALPMDNRGTNPYADLALLVRCIRLFGKERPDLFIGYTVKPNTYGAIAARWLGIATINNIVGLGSAFIRENWLTKIVQILYRAGLYRARKVFFLNRDDLELFVSRNLARSPVVEVLPGEGVDTTYFLPRHKEERASGPLRFLFVGRLLWDKGVGEFVEAARLLTHEGIHVEFQLAGFLEAKNPTAISRNQVEAWEREAVIKYLGATSDVRPLIAQADCIVLPSYREGMPKSLLEAASMGKPLVATRVAGCKEAIIDGETGLLCQPQDSKDLTDKIRHMCSLSEMDRLTMGAAGRKLVLSKFDEKIVLRRYLQVVEEILDPPPSIVSTD